ncbi:hypothetical protein F444_05951 [Phytophthora nicotianae P1976]|uniref:Uncharacterized protein n=1 Tax=Phytophthora nicotianae P1976 TaxID=1317066 RepID=A0A081AKB8_PHYNI|nr:hypothetical protein F444_05951 [Phytophthora nicotianae P1976]
MALNRSPNPRPRQQRRRHEEDTAADAASSTQSDTGVATDSELDMDIPHSTQQSPVDPMAMMRQIFEYMSTTQRQNQGQMTQMLQQQKPQKKKGNPPSFNGQASDDIELWLFSTE